MNDEKVIHAENNFNACDKDTQQIADSIIVGIHSLASVGCLIGSKKIVNKYIKIEGLGSGITKAACTLALGYHISSKLPLEASSVTSLKRLIANLKKKGGSDGTDSNAGENSDDSKFDE